MNRDGLPTFCGTQGRLRSLERWVCAHEAVYEDSDGAGAVPGCHSRVGGVGVGYLHEGIDKGFAVVGDFDYEVLDGSWVERR